MGIFETTLWASLELLLLWFDLLCFTENLVARNPMNVSVFSNQLRHVLPKFLFVGRQMSISFSAATFIDHTIGTWSQCCWNARMIACSCSQAVPARWGTGWADKWWPHCLHKAYDPEAQEWVWLLWENWCAREKWCQRCALKGGDVVWLAPRWWLNFWELNVL